MGHMCNMEGIFVQGAYNRNVNCMYTSGSGHIIDYIEFI